MNNVDYYFFKNSNLIVWYCFTPKFLSKSNLASIFFKWFPQFDNIRNM